MSKPNLVQFSTFRRTVAGAALAALGAFSVVPAQAEAVVIGSSLYNYQGLEWSTLSSSGTGGPAGSGNAIFRGETISRGHRSALALGLTAAEAPAAPTAVFPGNAAVAFARYNPYTKQGRIDVFRLQKTAGAGSQTAHMQHAVFAPRHGDAWVAARAYISPGQYATGSVRGVNPFSSFGGGDTFENISLAGMKVALGHAMRLSNAGAGLMAMADSRLDSKITRRKSLFKKTVETWVYGYVKSRWWLAFPGDGLDASLWSDMAAICATSPSATSCAQHATAVSGAIFQEVEGGGLDSTEDMYLLDYQRKSGLTVLGGLMFSHLAGPLVGIPNSGLMGAWYADRHRPRATVSVDTTASPVIEAGYRPPENSGVAGGSVGTGVLFNRAVSGSTGTAAAAGAALPALSNYQQRVMGHIPPVDTPVGAGAGTLKGFTDAVQGPNGMIPSAGQYVEANHVQYVRDSNGAVLRDQADH